MSVAVSVIMPFHNSETTIERAIASLDAQECDEEIEFVLVNDGSTDRSVEIVQYYAAMHPEFGRRLRFVTYPFRQGAAAAEAQGMKSAQGEYLARLDSDDVFAAGAIQTMLGRARKDDSDIVVCDFFIDSPGKKPKPIRLNSKRLGLNRMPLTTAYFCLWNKLIRRELLESGGIMPVSGIDCWDDVSVSARALAMTDRISHVAAALYHYSVNQSKVSLSRSHRDIVLRQRLMCALLLEKWFDEKGLDEKYAPFLNLMKFNAKIKLLRSADRDVAKWKETFPEVNGAIMSLRQMPLYLRVAFWLVDRMPVTLSNFCCKVADSLRS
ncbi:MAG: glycosyltransferase [Paramuribaculum sp.]|nr:glycosyltransferase [Paramuribaculum sp.]